MRKCARIRKYRESDARDGSDQNQKAFSQFENFGILDNFGRI